MRARRPLSLLPGLLVPLLALLAPDADAQGDRQDAGLSREQMWRAPTAEDWARPVLVPFQRTWEDAVALSKETNKAILVCVNMDGEIASEHYAGIRYRQPDVAKLYEPYVCVMASVYRHVPRDHDENGARVLCPRFGSVTCGEHIAIEPLLYEKFMDGKRIAPRHIMVELDGEETYDVYYAFDTASVFDTVREGIEQRDAGPVTEYRGDRPLLERVASRDVRDRRAVEEAYREGDRKLREALLAEATKHPDVASADLLRLAVFGLDVELAKLAREALARSGAPGAVDLIADTLATPVDPDEKEALVAALERLGPDSPRAKTLATVHRGLARRSETVDAERWATALQGEYRPAPYADPDQRARRLEAQSDLLAAQDPEAAIELAETFLAEAREYGFEDDHGKALLADARKTAKEAEKLGAEAWRVNAVQALAAYWLGDRDVAYARAEVAAGSIPEGDASWNSMAVLDLFAKQRWRAIVRSLRAKEEWPRKWLTDIHAACSILARHPHGTDAQAVWHYDRLKWLGAEGQARQVLQRGLERFPDSWDLHDRLRTRALAEGGVAGLEAVYDRMLSGAGDDSNLEWFAGYASIVAAEFHRRRGEGDAALAAYDRAIAHYARHVERHPDSRGSSDHYVALARAGRGRVAFEAGDHAAAVAELVASFETSPDSAATQDGLNLSPVDTAKLVVARLDEAGEEALKGTLAAALAALDPVLLEPPAYETAIPGGPSFGRRPPRGAGG